MSLFAHIAIGRIKYLLDGVVVKILWIKSNKKNNLGCILRTINIETFLFPSKLGLNFFSFFHRLVHKQYIGYWLLRIPSSWPELTFLFFLSFFLNRSIFILLILGQMFSSFNTQHNCLLGWIFSDPLQKTNSFPILWHDFPVVSTMTPQETRTTTSPVNILTSPPHHEQLDIVYTMFLHWFPSSRTLCSLYAQELSIEWANWPIKIILCSNTLLDIILLISIFYLSLILY